MTTAKTKFLIGGALVLGTAGFLMWNSIVRTSVYSLTPQELAAKISEDSTFRRAGVKLGGMVVPGSIVRTGGREVAFNITDGVQVYPVVYNGIIPDTFNDSAAVVVDGRLGPTNTFTATTLLAKCGSRFENAPPAAYDRANHRTRTT